jgi:hypothetical protein
LLLYLNQKKVDMLQIIDSQDTCRLSNHGKLVRSKIIHLQHNCISLDISKNSTLGYKLSWCKTLIAKGYTRSLKDMLFPYITYQLPEIPSIHIME